MIREVVYIPYEAQDEYREAGWLIEPLTHTFQREYSLMASRVVEGEE